MYFCKNQPWDPPKNEGGLNLYVAGVTPLLRGKSNSWGWEKRKLGDIVGPG